MKTIGPGEASYETTYITGLVPSPEFPATYIVTGIPRSGTSMMMRALYEGMGRKVEVVVNDERKAKLNSGEWIPNHEYLEPSIRDFETPEFPRFHEGKLLKCLMAGMHPLWPMRGGLHIVQMWRDPDIVRESWERCTTMGAPASWLPQVVISQGGGWYEVRGKRVRGRLLAEALAGRRPFPIKDLGGGYYRVRGERIRGKEEAQRVASLHCNGYLKRAAACSVMLRNRRDVISHTDFWFADVVADARTAFETLGRAGWPIIDIDAAVKVIDPTKVRMADALAEAAA